MQNGYLYGHRHLKQNHLRILAALMNANGPLSARECFRQPGMAQGGGNMLLLDRMMRLGLLYYYPGENYTVVPTCRFIPADKL